MACNYKITSDILNSCTDAPIKGLDGQRAVVINTADLNRAQTTVNGATVSSLKLNTGADAYSITWFKELASVASEFAPNAEDVDGFTHKFMGRLPTTTADNAERANELKNGRFIVVVETSYKGTDQEDAFKIYGLDTGMELASLTNSSLENSGSMLFELETREGTVETYPYNVYLNTDYESSKEDFDALFASL